MASLLFCLLVAALLGGAIPSTATAAASTNNNNLTTVMSRKGCAQFARLLSSTDDALQTYSDNVQGGLTIFCPSDSAMKSFAPKIKNLSSDGIMSLLLYHAIPVYESLQGLRQGNGVDNTLATDGAVRDYNLTIQNDGNTVTIRTAAPEPTSIMSTVLDAEPLAIFEIDAVLQPRELFPPAPAPTPAPEPSLVANSPSPSGDEKPSSLSSPPAPAGKGKKSTQDKDSTADSGAVAKRKNLAAAMAAAAMVIGSAGTVMF